MKKHQISPEYAQDFLSKKGRKVTIEEAAQIVDYMYRLAETEIDKFNK